MLASYTQADHHRDPDPTFVLKLDLELPLARTMTLTKPSYKPANPQLPEPVLTEQVPIDPNPKLKAEPYLWHSILNSTLVVVGTLLMPLGSRQEAHRHTCKQLYQQAGIDKWGSSITDRNTTITIKSSPPKTAQSLMNLSVRSGFVTKRNEQQVCVHFRLRVRTRPVLLYL